jgi:hypothetical protein
MNSVGIDVQGFEELKRKITLLANDKDKKAEMLLILRQIAKPTLQASKTFVPVRSGFARTNLKSKKTVKPGTLKKSLGFITGKKGDARLNPTVYVGPRVKGQFDGYYGAWVHDGVNFYNKGYKRIHKKSANNHQAKSRSKGDPYMKKAYAATNGIVTADAERRMAKFIQRRIDKLS